MGLTDQLINQPWVHSHEEDKGDEMVFRPLSYAFPPSRGRHGFTLHSDGTAQLTGPGATDSLQSGSAEWTLEAPNKLVLKSPEETQVLQIANASPDRLVIKRIER